MDKLDLHTSKPLEASAIDRSVPEFPPADTPEEEAYFNRHHAPDYLEEVQQQVKQFIQFHQKINRRIAVVTSGGTTVPLENNTVRFIDNFSAGTRGATSAERFMENGYAVIFLHRQFSLLPYSRHYSHTNSFLDYMVETKDGKSVTVDEKYQVEMLQILKQYHYAKQNNLILLIPFTTVNQYLFTLRMISFQLSEQVNISSRCMHLFYLAAAVSDFFIPISRISEHKIQSQEEHGGANGGKLIIDLDPVPKFLKRLVSSWVPGAMIVSFKLETDNSILLKKATSALKRYNHQLVIGNLLQTRKHQVIFVTPSNVTEYNLSRKQEQEGLDVEGVIVPEVINLHSDWIKQAESH